MIEKARCSSEQQRPGKVSYTLLGGILWLYAVVVKKHKLVTGLPKDLKPPFIVVGNHSSFFDFVYAVRAFYPERISFVVARKYFQFSGLSWVMKTARAIPKSLFQSDTSTVIAMFKILKQGGVVGIYPEGQIAINGMTINNGDAIGKFVKKAGVPVVRILTGGAYFCNPPWSKSTRKGRVESTVSLVLTKEQLKELPVEIIMERIWQSIEIDNFAWQQSTGCAYRGKSLAQGLENILYICPRCRQEYTVTTQGSTILCKNCGTEGRYCENGHLDWIGENYFRHIGDWLNWQLAQEKEQIEAQLAHNGEFYISAPVELAMLKHTGKGTEVVGSGTFSADRDEYVYAGTLNGRTVRLVFATAGIRYLPFDCGRNFQIYSNDLLYEFRPENPIWCAKIANICEVLFALQMKQADSSVATR